MTEKPFLPRVEEFLDCTGALLQFRLTDAHHAAGVLLYAHQIDPEHSPGYEFSAWSATSGDAIGKLRRKIRDGISRRHMATHPKFGVSLLTHDLSGMIQSDGLVIDGRLVPFEKVVAAFQAFGGWQIEVRFKDASE